jgi:hypothetical protein
VPVPAAADLADRGLPDFAVFDPDGFFKGLVEVKPDTGKKNLSKHQKAVLMALVAYGVRCFKWSPAKGLEIMDVNGNLKQVPLEILMA